MNEINIKDLYKIELIPRLIMLLCYLLVLVGHSDPWMTSIASVGVYLIVGYFFILTQFLSACLEESTGRADIYKLILTVISWIGHIVWAISLLTYCYGNFLNGF